MHRCTWEIKKKIHLYPRTEGKGGEAREGGGKGSFSVFFSCSMQNSKKKSLSLWLKAGSTWAILLP